MPLTFACDLLLKRRELAVLRLQELYLALEETTFAFGEEGVEPRDLGCERLHEMGFEFIDHDEVRVLGGLLQGCELFEDRGGRRLSWADRATDAREGR